MTPKKGEKFYILRWRVFAKSARDAIKKASGRAPDEAFIDSDWEKENVTHDGGVGFRT